MLLSRILFVVAVVLGVVGAAAAAPLEAYGRLPAIETAAVSPSGAQLAYILTDGERRMIVVQDVASKAVTLKARVGDTKVRDIQWAGERHLLITATLMAVPSFILNARREWSMAFAFDLQTGQTRPLLRDAAGAMNTIFDTPMVRTYKGEPMVFLQGIRIVEGRGRLSLYRVDLDGATSKLVEEGGPNTTDWVLDPVGEPLAQELYDSKYGRWSLRLRSGGEWREVQAAKAMIDRPYVLGLGRDGRTVLYAMADGEEDWSWREVSLTTGAAAVPLSVQGYQVPLRDPQDGRLIGLYALVGDETRYTFFDPKDVKVWKAVSAAFPGQNVDLESWSNDRRKIVVWVDSPTEGPAYAIVDVATGKASWLGVDYPDLKSADIGAQSAVRFKARDGLDLTGYLTLPPGATAKNLPLIVFPHSGPADRDVPGFDWWAQGMASRGYAVLQVNFRGSDSLGRGLLEAGFGEWGRKMQTDLSDGVRYLAAQGAIDPKRVCIVGGRNYGGYAALAGATLDRGVYRCAVSFAGVTDLRRQVAYFASRGGDRAERYWNRFIGAEGRNDDVMAEYSPARQAAKADIPILLIHGKDDTVVPLQQSQLMADALAKAGKPHELVVFKGEDHWLSRGETRMQMLTATMAFVEKHNPPK